MVEKNRKEKNAKSSVVVVERLQKQTNRSLEQAKASPSPTILHFSLPVYSHPQDTGRMKLVLEAHFVADVCRSFCFLFHSLYYYLQAM